MATVAGSVGPVRPALSLPRRPDLAFLPLHVAVTTLVAIGAIWALAARVYEPAASHDPIAIATGLVVLGLIFWVRYFLGFAWSSGALVYLILFWTFHFGMTFTGALIPSALQRLTYDEIEWFYSASVRESMILGVLGAVGFVAAVGLFMKPRAEADPSVPVEPAHDPALYGVGWLLMLVALVAVVFVLVQNGGFAVFTMTYLDFRSTVLGNTILPTALETSALGCLMAICGAGGRRWRWPFGFWCAVIPVPFLLIGMRGTVMIPLLAFFVVLAHRGVRFRPGVLLAVGASVSIIIPAVYAIRHVGFANRDMVNWTEVTPLDTVVELGGSLQSTQAYVQWIEEGDHYLLGASYWAPFDRQLLVRLMPGREQIPYEKDERIPLRMMDQRQGAVGGSATGEAYYNFGPSGPVLFYGAIGLLFGWLERRLKRTPYGSALLGVAVLLLSFNIRSDWLSVPASIGQGLALVGLCYALRRFAFRAADRVPPPPGPQPATLSVLHPL